MHILDYKNISIFEYSESGEEHAFKMRVEIIGYTGKGTDLIQRKYHKLQTKCIPLNKVIIACARDFSCFIRESMTRIIH